jgi:AraC-like DNA-binding protein
MRICGFENAQHFHRIFKAVTGQSQLQFRKSADPDWSRT